jgi:hypothetical protein
VRTSRPETRIETVLAAEMTFETAFVPASDFAMASVTESWTERRLAMTLRPGMVSLTGTEQC